MVEKSSYVSEKNLRTIILTDLHIKKCYCCHAHSALTFHASGPPCNWYYLLLLVCVQHVCVSCQYAHWQEMELRVLIVPLDRDWVTWEEWRWLDFRGMGVVVMEPQGRLKDVFWHVALNSCNPAWSDRFTQPNTYCIFQFIITSINTARKKPF